MTSSACVVIPVYNQVPNSLEVFNLTNSVRNVPGCDFYVVHPEGMSVEKYERLIPGARYLAVNKNYFLSNKTYSRLCLEPFFYEMFAAYEFMLLLQTDALIIKDCLDDWVKSGYDYIGAPLGVSISVSDPTILDGLIPPCSGYRRSLPVGSVGNGGFSLRRTRALLEAINRFSTVSERFRRYELPEDIYFSFVAVGSDMLKSPCETIAAKFSIEMNLGAYLSHTTEVPFGCHAWHRHDSGSWLNLFRAVGLDVGPVEALYG
jgi:hypothetical protein